MFKYCGDTIFCYSESQNAATVHVIDEPGK